MKSLIRKIFNSKVGIFFRNNLNIYPLPMIIKDIKLSSISDAFAWRTDNRFVTKFKFSDILNFFYKIEDSTVEIYFYTKNYDFIKKITFNDLSLSNELIIDENLLDGLRDYGTFYVHHFTNRKFSEENIISNRCYIGYSQNNNLYSYVHGNTLVKHKKIYKDDNEFTDIIKTSFFTNQNYKIQKIFNDFDKSELFIINPTSKKIRFFIDNDKHYLRGGCAKLINIKGKIIVNIQSNCYFLRPTVFSYKNEYLDVHHA
jgi:hypothetical protein